MKKILLLALFSVLSFSCSSDDDYSPVADVTSDVDNSGLTMTPDAKIEYNDSNFGLYKGVVVGESGIVTVNLNNNNDDMLTAKIIIDGITYNFTTTETAVLNQDITGLTFTSGNSFFELFVDAGGHNPQITNIYLEAYPDANIEVVKEYSDALVRCYLGTFAGAETGEFNIIRIANSLYGLRKLPSEQNSYYVEGTIGTDLRINGVMPDGTFTGIVNGATFSGNWTKSGSQSGSWTVNRIL